MRITGIEPIVLRAGQTRQADSSFEAFVVRVHTDAGVVGIGEALSSATVMRAVLQAPTSHGVALGFQDMLLGEDPLEPERLWDRVYRGSLFYGRRGAVIHALSAIDIALWDIRGQVLGLPISALLGGAIRRRVRPYASHVMPDSPDRAATLAAGSVRQGFTAVKLGWGPLGRSAALDEALVRAVREAVGPEIEVMIDVGLCWDAATAVQRVRQLERYRPYWIEEPLPPDDLEGYARLADAVDTRIAAGEELTTRWEFRDLLERGRVDVVQPDVARAGGFSETRRVLAMAEARHTEWAPHVYGTGILQVAAAHLVAASPGGHFLEYCMSDSPLSRDLAIPPLPLREGLVDVPDRPGLGVTLDEAVLARFRVA
jgi:L-alanine-DL-glutamate epimerase-like enolase superfamily enzyme